VKLPDGWSRAQPLFDDENLVSYAGLVPVMGLAERAGLSELIASRVAINVTRVRSAGVNPAGKLTSIIAGMAVGADSIDDLDATRSGGMPGLFAEVYAPASLGQFLREFTHGHSLQLASVGRAHLVNLVERTGLLPGIQTQAFIDIDSLLRPVYGHAKQGASFGHTKIAGRQVLRRGLSPLATIISTAEGAPVVAGIRLRAGKAGSGKGAASMVREAIATARAAGATGEILVRGDSAYGASAVVGTCVKAKVRFSVVLTKNQALNQAVNRAIGTIPDDAWTPVRYPGAVVDPDTGELISDAEVAETELTAFTSTKHPVTARLVVRRVRDKAKHDELFPVWRYHPFFTNSTEPTVQADITHRGHAVHRDRVRRPHRRTAGPPTLRPLCGQQRMGDLRGHHPQPTARRRHLEQPQARRRPRRDPTPSPRQRARPAGPTAAPPSPAPARALALGRAVDRLVDGGVQPRHRTTDRRVTIDHPLHAADRRPTRGSAGQASGPTMPHPRQSSTITDQGHEASRSTDRG
jgi:Transposase DDE domain group 1